MTGKRAAHGRRKGRRIPALAAAAVAAAHGGNLHFAIAARTDGRTQATASYDDGDPVDEPVVATLSALSSDGRSLGPWPL
ncbi:hypothetical protein P3T37_003669 [Kitasatospora sp. MAA4]|uniref:hypothetical protein n=1 Tax=Kitasatospora sp. MAA4 TaxID=3035093 RepID=UPI002473C927|nr:hypothetical protein [Kitasatospora sp. MAA4]MDH6134267.1 hypothetical protein [Kitasatospora sp. MAA4]